MFTIMQIFCIICIRNILTKKDYIIPSLALLCFIALLINGPVPQDQSYHNFADQRNAFGIPNFLNVITNLPFAFVGLWGLWEMRSVKEKELKHISFTLFMGFILLAFGSSYYHRSPENLTLVYDRLPMVILFMSFFAFIIYDRIDRRKGYNAFIILNITGILTVIYWILSERAGKGDLRWYGMVQFYPIIAIPLILFLYKSSFNYWKEMIAIFIFFGLAKLAELFDKEIYHLLSGTISGHSLKHLFMVAAEYEIVVLMRRRVKWSA
ncbi:MAG: alkaline phytoceramidase [Segetibacter sp.]|nr:alkaline phytoceramidase [Segetibacter sp.]